MRCGRLNWSRGMEQVQYKFIERVGNNRSSVIQEIWSNVRVWTRLCACGSFCLFENVWMQRKWKRNFGHSIFSCTSHLSDARFSHFILLAASRGHSSKEREGEREGGINFFVLEQGELNLYSFILLLLICLHICRRKRRLPSTVKTTEILSEYL